MEKNLSYLKIKDTYYAIPSKSIYIRALILAAFLNDETKLIGLPLSEDIYTAMDCLNRLGADIKETEYGVLVKGLKDINKEITLDCKDSATVYRFLKELVPNPLTGSNTLLKRVESSITSQTYSGRLLRKAIFNIDVDMDKSNLPSKGYIDLTEKVIKDFKSHPKEYIIEGDYSNAAMFLALGAIKGNICVKGLNENSIQPDQIVLKLLKEFGAEVETLNDGIYVSKGHLQGITVDGSLCPDLVPIISVMGCFSKGETRINNIGYLKNKESNRINAITEILQKLGGNIEATEDSIRVKESPLGSGCFDSYKDHRMIMMLTLISLCTGNNITINNCECINKSYKNFFEIIGV